MNSKNHLVWYLIPVAVVLLGVGVLIGRLTATQAVKTTDTPTAKVDKANDAVMTVEAISPVQGMVASSISASGVIAGKDEAVVGTRMNGVAVVQVLVEEGDWVKAGQVLAVLDDQHAKQDVVAAEAKLHTAQAALAKASADLKRAEPLIEIDAISREQYDGYQTAKMQAQNDVTSAQAALNNAITNRTNGQVIAPVSGIVSKKSAEVGMITTGSPLFHVIKGGVLEWQASVPMDKAMQLKVGQALTLQLNGLRSQSGSPNAQIMGYISRISPIANNSRELTVHATLTGDVPVVAGMFVQGEFMTDKHTAWLIPVRVVSSGDGYDYVWTLKATDTKEVYEAVATRIDITQRAGDMVATNLPNDVLIVKQGGNFLSDGDRVRVVNHTKQNQSTVAP